MPRMIRTPVWMTFGAVLLLTLAAGGARASDSRPHTASDDQGVWTFVGFSDHGGAPSGAYDPTRRRFVVLRLTDSPPYGVGTVYSIQLGETVTHGPLVTIDPPNSVPAGSPAIYDPINDRLIVYSGTGSYALSFSTPVPTWSVLPAGALPPPRTNAVAVYDPAGERMVIFGGETSPYDHLNDVWAYSFATESWSNITPSESPVDEYHWGIAYHAAIYDPIRSRLVSYGGAYRYFSPSWSTVSGMYGSDLGTPAWEKLPYGDPYGGPRADHSLVYDSNRDRLVTFGGRSAQVGYVYGSPAAYSLETEQWTSLTPTGTGPTDRYNHIAAYDPEGDRMVLFGGSSGGQEIWLLTWQSASVGVGPAAANARLGVRAPGSVVRGAPFAVTTSFAQAGQARLDLMDVGGRIVESVSLRVDGPGERAMLMGRASMQPGVYFLRLGQNGAQARAKVALIR